MKKQADGRFKTKVVVGTKADGTRDVSRETKKGKEKALKNTMFSRLFSWSG